MDEILSNKIDLLYEGFGKDYSLRDVIECLYTNLDDNGKQVLINTIDEFAEEN